MIRGSNFLSSNPSLPYQGLFYTIHTKWFVTKEDDLYIKILGFQRILLKPLCISSHSLRDLIMHKCLLNFFTSFLSPRKDMLTCGEVIKRKTLEKRDKYKGSSQGDTDGNNS